VQLGRCVQQVPIELPTSAVERREEPIPASRVHRSQSLFESVGGRRQLVDEVHAARRPRAGRSIERRLYVAGGRLTQLAHALGRVREVAQRRHLVADHGKMGDRRQPWAAVRPPCGAVQVGGRGVRYRAEATVFVDRREVEIGQGLLAMLEVVAYAQEVDNREQQEDTDERPGNRQDDEDAAAQRLMGCGGRRGTDPRGWRRRS
jgi:hypothetical protein